MSRLREYLGKTDFLDTDFERVHTEWDIPLDENITAYEANMWLHARVEHNGRIDSVSVTEGMSNDDWDVAVEFISRCLRHGVEPHEYVHQLIKRQQIFNDLVFELPKRLTLQQRRESHRSHRGHDESGLGL